MMSSSRIDEIVTSLIDQLPLEPRPASVRDLCRRVAEQRARPLFVRSVNVPALPFGLWYCDGKRDYILYRAGCSGYHCDHIILHEICHMFAEDNLRPSSYTDGGDVLEVIEYAATNPRTDLQEEVAETFAARVLKLLDHSWSREPSEFERRAAAMLGAVDVR